MGDAGDCPDSPPLPRGAYSINFDELDDSIDPFKPRGGIGSFPGNDVSNPFKARTKLGSSPPNQTQPIPVTKKSKKKKLSNDEDAVKTEDVIDNVVDSVENPVTEEVANGVENPHQDVVDYVNEGEENPVEDVVDNINEGEVNPVEDFVADEGEANLAEDVVDNINEGEVNPVEEFVADEGEANPVEENNIDHKYELDMDDENPFKTKSKIAKSPTGKVEEDNPFKTKTKLGHSPPVNSYISDEDPFKSKSKLGKSPPGNTFDKENRYQNDSLDNSMQATDVCNNDQTAENCDNTESRETGSKGLKTRLKSQTPPASKPEEDLDQNQAPYDQDGGSEPAKPKPVKKPASPKKSGLKKPKAKSKFKPPANFGVPDTDEVVIFAPPPPALDAQSANEHDNFTLSQSGAEFGQEEEPYHDQPIDSQADMHTTHGMTTSEVIGRDSRLIDSVHDFGASDMPIESNEDFVPPSEAFDNEEAWEMMAKMKHENGARGRESLNAFDPLADQQVPDKVTRRISDTGIDGDSVLEDEDLLLMNTPPSQKQHSGTSRGVARHPAARALQEHVEGDGAPKEAHIIDKMLFSPTRGEDPKLRTEVGERYFDAPEYPIGSNPKGDSDVERMNASKTYNKYGTNSDISQENIVQLVQVLKYSQSDWNKMKQDLELDFNARILNKEREWTKKLADRDKKISYLEDQVLTLRSSNDDMKCVVTEFEKTIAQLQAEKEKTTTESQQTFGDIVKERDQALEDLQSVETAFSDLHQRYERTKGVVEGFKKNEDVLKKCVQDYQVKLKAAEDKTVSVRQQAEEKLALASDEMDKLRKSTTSEVARLEAALKKTELKIQGLERSLEQKMQENSELTAICDELIAKVGGD